MDDTAASVASSEPPSSAVYKLVLEQLWRLYFGDLGPFNVLDSRLGLAMEFVSLFRGRYGGTLLGSSDVLHDDAIHLNYSDLLQSSDLGDLDEAIREYPSDSFRCLGLALSFERAARRASTVLEQRQQQAVVTQQILAPGTATATARDEAALAAAMAQQPHVPITVRVEDVKPYTPIKEIRSGHIGQFLSVRGTVLRVSGVRPLVVKMSFRCGSCGQLVECAFQDGQYMPPSRCSTDKCRSKTFMPDRSTAETIDWQKIKLQSVDDDDPDPGRVPRTIEVDLTHDLVDACVPGDVVSIAGTVKSVNSEVAAGRGMARARNLFVLYLEAHSVASNKLAVGGLLESRTFSERDRAAFRRIAAQPDPFALVVASMCPMIFGHAAVKAGLTLGLFGGSQPEAARESAEGAGGGEAAMAGGSSAATGRGQGAGSVGTARSPAGEGAGGGRGATSAKEAAVQAAVATARAAGAAPLSRVMQGTSGAASRYSLSVRADPHILVVGDPGLGKSQMLRAVAALAPRGVYVSGNTTSATGLTVTMARDPATKDFGLEAGALVLSDQGICCIDEFDKMASQHAALLEAMEQQRISVAKAGIVCSLSARATVLAAANPAGGHYDRGKTIMENLRLSAPVLSRFDLVFIMLDDPDEEKDRQLSRHIIDIHTGRHSALVEQGPAAGGGGRRATPADRERQKRALERRAAAERQRRQAIAASVARAEDRAARTQASQTVAGSHGAAASMLMGAGGGGAGAAGESFETRLRRRVLEIDDPLPQGLLRKYVAFVRRCCHPVLTPEAAGVLQECYIGLRQQSGHDEAVPITTRQLESLVRLSQARARVEMRSRVSRQDAEDVVGLMKQSLLDAATDALGFVDFSRAGGMSMGAQVKAFAKALGSASARKGSSVFSREELVQLMEDLRLRVPSTSDFLETLNQQNYVIKKGPRLYQVLVSSFGAFKP